MASSLAQRFALDDDSDSDDSGFDEGLSSDERLISRIAKMRDMMNLKGAAPPPTIGKPAPPPPRATSSSASTEEGDFPLADKAHELSLSSSPAIETKSSPPPQRVENEEDEDDDDDDDEDDGYRVAWTRGELGILFKEGPKGQTVIRRVNKKKSCAEGLHLARAGDVLVAMNGATVVGRDFQTLVEQLRLPKFPVVLHFRPLQDSSDDDDEYEPTFSMASTRQPSTFEPRSPPPQYDAVYDPQSPTPELPPPKYSSIASARSPQSPKESIFAASQAEAVAMHRQQNSASIYEPMVPMTPYTPEYNSAPGVNEFDVVWRQGTLGCGLKQIDGVPTIKSVREGAAVDPSVQQIAPGDIMIRINGQDPNEIGFRGVVAIMQQAPKPVYMRFFRPHGAMPPGSTPGSVSGPPQTPGSFSGPPPLPSQRPGSRDIDSIRSSRVDADDMDLEQSLGPRQYTVLWTEGPLGVQIKAKDGAVVVSKFTGTGDPVVCRQIAKGDAFIRIAGRDVAPLGVLGAHELLRTVQKPVVIVFERGSSAPPFAPRAAPPPSPPASPAPPIPPPMSNHPRESVVPSFKELREQQPELRLRQSFSTEHQGEVAFGATQRRALIVKALESEERRSEADSGGKGGGPSRHHSFAASKSSHQSDQSVTSCQGEDTMLPRFSDIEQGRIKTTAVTLLPPPPAYLDVFTQSGRAIDPGKLLRRQHTEGDSDSASSASLGPPTTPSGGIPRGGAGGAGGFSMSMSPYLQPPPSYDQHRGGADDLRKRYVEADRLRNTAGGGREQRTSPSSPLPPPQVYRGKPDLGVSTISVLPPPELWIKWSEGPLGITFRRVNGQIVVSRLTGAGYSPGLGQLRPGDWLVSFGSFGIGSYNTDDLRLSETMDLIKSLPKPVDMCFLVK